MAFFVCNNGDFPRVSSLFCVSRNSQSSSSNMWKKTSRRTSSSPTCGRWSSTRGSASTGALTASSCSAWTRAEDTDDALLEERLCLCVCVCVHAVLKVPQSCPESVFFPPSLCVTIPLLRPFCHAAAAASGSGWSGGGQHAAQRPSCCRFLA